ncbi:MAG: T9SS type A sorting domain-containing protein, partial [Bacteroidota bacterium]
PNHICPGTCTDFTNLSVNATSFQWNFSGANPSSSTDLNPTNICYNTPGNYAVSLIATNAAGSDTITLNNFITVYPYPAPQGISQNGDTLFANAGVISYQWYQNGNIINGATDYFYVATESGNYNIVATDANGCEVEAAIFDVIAGIHSEVGNGSHQLSIFPNPAEDMLSIFNVKPGMNQLKINSISIYNTLGEMLFAVCLPIDKCRLPVEVDVSRLSSGLYYIEIMISEKISRNKFIKN